MSDTPETDALLLIINEGRIYKDEGPIEAHARRLEHQRNEWMDRTTDALALVGNLTEQRDAYAETLRMLRVECYDFIDQRHPELAEEK